MTARKQIGNPRFNDRCPRAAPSTLWTDPVITRLTALWTETGESASGIARILAEDLDRPVTKSMVLGKIHRLGLSGRRTVPVPVKTRETRPAAVERRAPPSLDRIEARRRPVPAVPAPDPGQGTYAITDLRQNQCRYPIGHDGIHRFCGCRVERGPYCAEHAAACFREARIEDDEREAA